MNRFLALDPIRALHDHWRGSSPELHLAVGGAGFGGWAARVDWAAALGFASIAVMTLGGCAIQLWKQWRLAGLEIRDAERKIAEPKIIVPTVTSTVTSSR
jgi:hypothetical protein